MRATTHQEQERPSRRHRHPPSTTALPQNEGGLRGAPRSCLPRLPTLVPAACEEQRRSWPSHDPAQKGFALADTTTHLEGLNMPNSDADDHLRREAVWKLLPKERGPRARPKIGQRCPTFRYTESKVPSASAPRARTASPDQFGLTVDTTGSPPHARGDAQRGGGSVASSKLGAALWRASALRVSSLGLSSDSESFLAVTARQRRRPASLLQQTRSR